MQGGSCIPSRLVILSFGNVTLRFRLPISWEEAPSGSPNTATFVGATAHAPSFRVTVVRNDGFVSPKQVLTSVPSSRNAVIEDLQNEKVLMTHAVTCMEGGREIETIFWHLAVPAIPTGVVVAIFSYCILKRWRGLAEAVVDVGFLETEIRQAQVVLDITDFISGGGD